MNSNFHRSHKNRRGGSVQIADRRPYLDKLSTNDNITSSTQNNHEPEGINSTSKSVMPSLLHTGVKSSYGKATIPVNARNGNISTIFKAHTRKKLAPIFREDYEMSSKEDVFRTGHKQFIDKILLDLDERKKDSMRRRMRHWTTSKNRLGFEDSFNPDEEQLHNPSSQSPKSDIVNSREGFDTSMKSDQGQIGQVPAPLELPTNRPIKLDNRDLSSTNKAEDMNLQSSPAVSPGSAYGSTLNKSNAKLVNNNQLSWMSTASRRKAKPYSRMSLFRELLDTVDPPKSPIRRFGSMENGSVAGSASP